MIYYTKALSLTVNHNYKKAIEFFESCIRIVPQNNIKLLGLLYERLGICYADVNENDKAKYFLLKALEINPDSTRQKQYGTGPEIASRLGFIYKEEGDYLKAKEYLELAKKNKSRISYTNWQLIDKYLAEIEDILDKK